MATLRFPIAAARRVADHSIQAPEQMPQLVEFSQDGEEPVPLDRVPTEPCVQLVHDDGVYLMSNGLPPDLLDGTIEQGRRFVAYAEGCDPQHDPDWFETARQLVGGDDFSETLPWAKDIRQLARAGATHILLQVSATRLSLSGLMPPRRRRTPRGH